MPLVSRSPTVICIISYAGCAVMITAAVKHDAMTKKGLVDFTLLVEETSNNLINNCTLIMLSVKYGVWWGRRLLSYQTCREYFVLLLCNKNMCDGI